MPVHITPASIAQLSALIEDRIGIAVHAQFRETLYELLMLLEKDNVQGYINQLAASRETDPVWQTLVNALTIGETYFLRDRAHFHALKAHILPELIQKRRDEGLLYLNIWSVGCATGEEPYSVAITLRELLSDIHRWAIELIGTDLNAQALRIARRGVYRKWAFRHTDLDFQGRYFDPAPDGLMIKPDIQQMVTFRHANLFAGPPLPKFDLILCRNMLIYFSSQHARQAEQLLHHALVPGGWLLLGHAETIRHEREKWITHMFPGMPAYQRPINTATGEFRLHVPLVNRQPNKLNGNAALMYDAAITALQQESYSKAEAIITDLLDAQPDHAAAHTVLAYVLANRNHQKEAHEHIDLALKLDPLLANAHYLRAMLFMEDGKTSESAESLRSALYCQRNHPLASFVLGNIHARAGEFSKANRYWENARRAVASLKPDSPVSDISSITAGQLDGLVKEQIQGWQN